jgi:hypothetical protein
MFCTRIDYVGNTLGNKSLEGATMTTHVEQLGMRLAAKMATYKSRHVRRAGFAMPIVLMKCAELGPVRTLSANQIGLTYRNHEFKGRFNHRNGGHLQVVARQKRRDGCIIVAVRNAPEAHALNLRAVMDAYINGLVA